MNTPYMRFRSVGVMVLTSVIGLASLSILPAQGAEFQALPAETVRNNLAPFAGAYKEVSQIHTAYETKIVQSADQGEVNALQQEANQKMNQAVADHGLSIEDYNSIFTTIQGDPDLQEEFMTVINQTP